MGSGSGGDASWHGGLGRCPLLLPRASHGRFLQGRGAAAFADHCKAGPGSVLQYQRRLLQHGLLRSRGLHMLSDLTKKLESQMVPANGIYLENCKYVNYGYFGNLEVFSQAAFTTLLANIDSCNVSPKLNWK